MQYTAKEQTKLIKNQMVKKAEYTISHFHSSSSE